jgi:hypothetical protein
VTDWPEFSSLDLPGIARTMRTPLFLDGRNAVDPATAREAGLTYVGVGREPLPLWPTRPEIADRRLSDAAAPVS